MAETMLVRLKAYNRKKGHVLRRYTYGGIRFQEGRGWYRVEREVADYLASVHQIPHDEDSPRAFDVCTEAEARAIDEREARAAREVLPAEEAMDMTNRRTVRAGRTEKAARTRARREHDGELDDASRQVPAWDDASRQVPARDDHRGDVADEPRDDVDDVEALESFDAGLPDHDVLDDQDDQGADASELTTDDLQAPRTRRRRRGRRR